jgi:protein-L-isoaspartate(D-aspartate) O-methyltransferase
MRLDRRCFLAIAAASAFAQDQYAAARQRMVRQQIEARGIRDKRVLAAMLSTPRHLFVPPDQRKLAYEDHPLAIGGGQTISQPYIVALMTELLEVTSTHRVLEIGTGSGYQAAVLSPLAREIFTIEIVPELARSASALLSRLGLKNIMVRHGDGYKGWPEKAPFDRIILTAAPPRIPQALIDQLKQGGKLVAPEGASGFEQQLVVVDKLADGSIRRRSVLAVRFVPMVEPR